MAFSDLAIRAATEYAIHKAHANLAKISLFTHQFSELDGAYGQSLAVPIFDLSASSDFVAGTNDYGSGTNEINGMTITLDKHFVKPVAITDKELAFTGINWAKEMGGALAERITRDVNAYVFGQINETNVAQEADISAYISDTPSKLGVSGLYALAAEYDIPVERCIVALSPTYYSKILSLVDYNMLGTGDYLTTGVIEGLFGFRGFVCTQNLPEGTEGAILMDESVGVVSKYLAPDTPDAYPQAWKAVTMEGMPIGFRRFMNLSTGQNNFACDVLFGTKILQADKIVRLVAED